MERVRHGVAPARWNKTLAAAARGDRLRVEEIFFGTVRDALGELGIRRGSIVECMEAHTASVLVRVVAGGTCMVPREHASFVCVTDL